MVFLAGVAGRLARALVAAAVVGAAGTAAPLAAAPAGGDTVLVSAGARAAASRYSEFGRLEIPSLRVDARVAEGTDERTLRSAVGRIAGTAFPGDAGNVGLAAHRDSFFKDFSQLQFGDRVRLTTVDGAFDYAVDSFTIVLPNRVDVLEPVGYPVLTMVTCYPRWWAGPAPWRLIVRAREIARVPALRP
jgi:LPXTG-site transpeptidase (sortase) family protein